MDRDRGPESTSHRFMEFSALLDDKAEPLVFTISKETHAARGGLVELSIALDVESKDLGTNAVGEIDVVQLDVVGEITSAGEVMVDRFRYLFSVPQAEDRVGLTMDRLVRPGDYHLRVKVADVPSQRASVAETTVSVVALNFSEEALDAFVDPAVAAIEAELEASKEPEVQQPTRRIPKVAAHHQGGEQERESRCGVHHDERCQVPSSGTWPTPGCV